MKKTGKTAALALTMSMAVTAMPFGVSAEETDKTVVRINMESEPDNLDPWLSAASDTEAVFHNVFEGLVLFDETGALIPGLAESWDISDDGLTYTFHLRDDVIFHNGKAFSAEDVVYTYESLSGLGGEEALSSKFKNLTSVEAVDDYTVTMTLAEADAAFLQYTRVAVLPKGYEDQSSAPVGTGPFVFEKYVPGQMVVLEKNEDYYDESRMPKIDEAQIYIMGDDSAVLTALQSGQLDAGIVYADSADYLTGDFTVNSSPQNMVQLFALNNSATPFDDVRVRQAFEYAVNKDQIIDGVFAGVGSVLSFLPIIVVLFFFLSILEDSGYMARVAFVMDKPLRKIGLSGRSFVPMLIGFGCTVPAVMATRTLSSERDRNMTIMLTPFMSCSAKIPIYTVFAAAFFPGKEALVMILLYAAGIIVGIISALVLNHTAFRGNPIPFVMELPNYRFPSAKSVFQLMWDKAKDFIQRAFTVIFVATIIIWFLQTFDTRLNVVADSSNSLLALVGRWIAPVFAPLGFSDWRVSTALITGFTAKEAVVSTLSVLTGTATSNLSAVLSDMFSGVSVVSFLVFTLLYTPCVAAIAAVKREMGSGLKAALVVVLQCLVAWVVALLVYQVGGLLL